MFTIFGAWLGAITFFYFVFRISEDNIVDPVLRTNASNWLKNIKLDKKIVIWPMTFIAVFDGIFGKKHLSWRCIRRSCIASFVAVLILTLFWYAIHSDDFYSIVSVTSPKRFIPIYLLITVLFNPIPDYFSLLETRWIIGKIKNTNSTKKILYFLALDIVATVSIFLIGMIISLFLLIHILPFIFKDYSSLTYLETLSHYLSELYYSITLNSEHGNDITVGVWLYSTFFTSIWVWIYFISGTIIKILVSFAKLFDYVRKIIDIDRNPLRSMGYICCVLLFFGCITHLVARVVKPQPEKIFVQATKELAGKEIKDISIGGFYINRPKETSEELNKIVYSLKQKKTMEQYSFNDLYKIGVSEIDNGEFDNAIDSFTKALDKAPGDASKAYTYNYRGYTNLLLGRSGEAIADYDKAIDLDVPEHVLPHYNKGILVYNYFGQYEEAKINLNKAIVINPKYIASYIALSEMNIIEGDYKRALDTIDKAFSFRQKAEDAARITYIRCLVMKLLNMDTSLYETELNEILKMDFTISQIFDLPESWFKNANIDDDTKKYFKEKAELFKKHLE